MVRQNSGNFFEAVEVKHRIAITLALVEDAYEKIAPYPISRYYLLTTAEPNTFEREAIESLAERVRSEHGCEIIVNGVIPSLKYYLRLLENPGDFIECYNRNLLADYAVNTDIKKIHVDKWLELVDNLLIK